MPTRVSWKIWGPPTYPATVVDHDLRPGGRMTYFMTGPDGDKHAGYWEITAVDEPRSFEFDDGFADMDFNPNPDMPKARNVFTFAEHEGGTGRPTSAPTSPPRRCRRCWTWA